MEGLIGIKHGSQEWEIIRRPTLEITGKNPSDQKEKQGQKWGGCHVAHTAGQQKPVLWLYLETSPKPLVLRWSFSVVTGSRVSHAGIKVLVSNGFIIALGVGKV